MKDLFNQWSNICMPEKAMKHLLKVNQRSGFTLIEVSISIVLIAIALLALIGSTAQVTLLESTNEEEIVAIQACQTIIEQLENEALDSFSKLYSRYNENTDDDPGGYTSPGPHYEVEGLTPWDDDEDGFCGLIVFPEKNGNLTEDNTDPDFGEELSLDGIDGVADDVSTTYKMLPIKVVVQYRSMDGKEREKFIVTTIYGVDDD